MSQHLGKRQQPIYIYPSSFQFFSDDVNTHRQSITIYNSFEKPVKFKVLSTAPKRYLVDEPEGFIKAKGFIELTIRHHNSSFSDNAKDMLRIQVYQSGNMIFRRDLPLDSIASRAEFMINANFMEIEEPSPLGEFSSTFAHGNNLNSMLGLNSTVKTRTSSEIKKNPANSNNLNSETSVNYLVIFIGLICLTLIFLPNAGSSDSSIPVYMHMTMEAKLFASFVLGMVTMVILKS